MPYAPDPLGLAHQQPVGGPIGTARQLLEDVAVQMLAQPGVPKLLGIRLQRVVRKGVLCTGRSKEPRALGVLMGQDPRRSKGFGLAHEPDPLACLTQAGVVDLPCCFQAREQRMLLVRMHPQRDLADKGGGPFGALVSGSTWAGMGSSCW